MARHLRRRATINSNNSHHLLSIMFGLFGSKAAPPQLSFGLPINFSADVPIFPPFAMMLTMMTSRLIWKITASASRGITCQ